MPLDRIEEEKGIFLLPGGYYEGGELNRKVELRPLTGLEEEIIAADSSQDQNIAKLVTLLLSSCVLRIGAIRDITPEIVRKLLVADRDYLILKLRQLTFGDKVEGIIVCPNSECAQKIDIDFNLNDVEIGRKNGFKPAFLMKLSEKAAYKDGKGKIYREVEFRLPNGGDQEEIAPWVGVNEARAMAELYARCIKRIGSIGKVTPELVQLLTKSARQEIEAKIREVTPVVDLTMKIECPYCNLNFVNNFDLYEFFLNELEIDKEQLYSEIHLLALYYNWSEKEILSLIRNKRRMYVELLKNEIEQYNQQFE